MPPRKHPPGKHAAPAHAAQAMARRECRAILRALSSRQEVHESIHAARKAIRRLRALLLLVEDRLVEVATPDRILQRTGDSLSALRDAHVTIATAQRLAAQEGGERWQPVVAQLEIRRDALLDKTLTHDPGFARRRAWVERATGYLQDLDWDDLKPRDFKRGLKHGRRRADKAAKHAAHEPTPDNLHRWRRRVRKLRLQVEAVARIAPEVSEAVADDSPRKDAKALHKLSDRLGERQDIEVLRGLLRRMPDLPDRSALLAQLRGERGRLAAPTTS